MSAVRSLESIIPRIGVERTPKAWPTMYDLPSEDPKEPGLPDIFHDQQPQLLKETFQPPNYAADEIFVATDLNLYYDRQHKSWYKRPDWFAVVGVSRWYDGYEPRSSYVMWDEQVTPLLVVELLSPGTEEEDLGRLQRQPKEPPLKWEVYEQILQIPYYVVFSRYTNELHWFRLTQGRYVELTLLTKQFWFDDLQLGLGLWQGVYDGLERQWLRWYGANRQWIPTPAELAVLERQRAVQAEQQILLERQQATVAKQQAWSERQRAVQAERQRAVQAEQQILLEHQRATAAETRAEQLAAKLRALGIDPES